MPVHRSCRPAALLLATALVGLASPAGALNIVFTDVGATAMNSDQFSAFQTAALHWQSRLTDDVTVYVNIAFSDLGGNTLGSTTWTQSQVSYSDLHGLLALDAKSAVDASAVGHLQSAASLSFVATRPDLTARLDDNGSANNRMLKLTTANAKALGLVTSTDAAHPDATISFSNSYASSFAYQRGATVPDDKIDFVTLAEHEIGHALGFVSGVDGIDYCLDHAVQCGSPTSFDDRSAFWFYALDLYRYSAAGTLNLAVGGAPYFSVDGGATAIRGFSSGTFHGDGNQAHHFVDMGGELMGPHVYYGVALDASAADLTAMDAIGWDVSAVPEPQTYALLLSGLAVLGWARRRR